MPDIRPISDLRSNFMDIAKELQESGKPIFLTKNGYGSLVVLSIEAYETLCSKAIKYESAVKQQTLVQNCFSHRDKRV